MSKIKNVHPFPARMAPDLALSSLASLPRGSVVLDPMSGSGTVLRQALELGHKALGFDVDPLAVLMSRVWTSMISEQVYLRELDSILAESKSVDLRRAKVAWHDEETRQFVRYWFGKKQAMELSRLAVVFDARRKCSLGVSRRRAINALQVALSRIIVTKEQCASLARDTSHSRPHRVTLESNYDVREGFIRSAKQVLTRLKEVRSALPASVDMGDARDVNLPSNSVDAVLTSPPYLNAIDYMRGHRMSLVWLGYSLNELRAIRSGAVGAERASRCDSEETESIVSSMCNPRVLSSRHRGMIHRYAIDLRLMLKECQRTLKPGGAATYVVGNSCLRGVFVDNASGVEKAAELAGFELKARVERDLPAASRYLPITDEGLLSKRMRTETVISLMKVNFR